MLSVDMSEIKKAPAGLYKKDLTVYFFVVSAGRAGTSGEVEFAGLVTSVPVSPVLPLWGMILMSNTITINDIISTQVPFSRKSPVRCTPITLLDPAKPDERPPPLGFWIKIIRANSIQTIIARITRVMNMIKILINFFFYFSNLTGKVSAFFREFQT